MTEQEFLQRLRELAARLQEECWASAGGGEYGSGYETGRNGAGEALEELLNEYRQNNL